MMHLPEFSEQHPSTEFLRSEQERLVRQADKMMAETKIMDIFAKHGKFPGVGGSYKYRLMIYPDLDIGIIAEEVNKTTFTSLLSDVAASDYAWKVSAVDAVRFSPVRSSPAKHVHPTGYWIGVEIPYENDRWGIDCWLRQPDWVVGDGRDAYADRLAELDQDARDTILAIKYDLIRTRTYGKEFLSGHVYDSVLDGNVRSVEGFYKWSKE